MSFTLLAVGDVSGANGLEFIQKRLWSLRRFYNADFAVVNGENASGVGITAQEARDIFAAGADVVTLGNHTFAKFNIMNELDDSEYLLRPENLSPYAPGKGVCVCETPKGRVCVVNLIGRCNLDFNADNPFFTADRIFSSLDGDIKIRVVDFHSEATSEKCAMGYYLDGRASAVYGTHTHVQTADEKILDGGTGYISDLGMTGPEYSVLGVKPEQSIDYFLGKVGFRFEHAMGKVRMCGALFDIDENTGKCIRVERLNIGAE